MLLNIKIDKEFLDLIPPLQDEELTKLEQSIKSEGCREAIITWNGVIVDGHNRYSICTKNNLPFKTVERNFASRDEVIVWMIQNQLGRRNLSNYDRARLALRYEQVISPGQGFRTDKLRQKSDKVDTKKEIAKIAKVSHDTVAKVKVIEKLADEETKKKLSNGEETINKAYTNLTKKIKREEFVEEAKRQIELPDKKYSIIYADPPWKYWAGGNKNATTHYNCMELEDIKSLGVPKLAADNSILFLWTTYPMLRETFEVLDSWGFKYSTVGFVWVKRNKNDGNYFFGLGNWTRANSEICIIATKGQVERQSASVSQIIDTAIDEHSKKPEIVKDKIIELVGDLPRIELFARRETKGWDAWGNQINNENGGKQ